MKFIIIAISLALIGGGIVLVSKKSSVSEPTVSPSQIVSQPTQDFLLAELNPDVFVKELGTSDFSKFEKQKSAKEGSEVKTGKVGRASVLYPNGNIANITKDTVIKLASVDQNSDKSKVEMTTGGIWSKVKNLSGSESYEVKTENAVASVRGTIFALVFEKKFSWIIVFEHKVFVQAINPKTGQPIPGAVAEVLEGEKVFIDSKNLPPAGKPLKKEPITLADLERQVIKENIGDYSDNPSIKKILENLKIKSPGPTQSYSPLPSQKPNNTSTPSPTLAPSLSPMTTPKPTPLPSPKATANTATPTPEPTVNSVSPSSIASPRSGEAEFAINGANLSNTSQVFLNNISIPFTIIDNSTIFGRINSNIPRGIYDVSVVTKSGSKAALYKALEIK